MHCILFSSFFFLFFFSPLFFFFSPFALQVQEKRLEAAREEERILEAQRQFEEEQGPGVDKENLKAAAKNLGETNKEQSVRNMFNFAASEQISSNPFKGTYTYYDMDEQKV